MSIGTLVKSIQDIMRKDVGVDGDAQRISQMVWLLFLKIFDDKEAEWMMTVRDYKSPLQKRFRWANWAKDAEGITGEELIDFVNNELFPSLKKLATSAGVSPVGKVVGSVFEDSFNYMKSGTLLRQVINTIESDVDFNSSQDRHLFNDIYEKILSDLQSAGNAGEYYTPRAVTQFMVDMLDPQLGEKILDPACGTGGFLTCTLEHLRKQVKNASDRKAFQNSIHGVEKKPLPHMLAITNMMLHGIDVPTNILHDNTLSRPLKDYGPKDRVDLIITNPPFGGMEEDGIENNFPKKYQTRETADLFMALIMHLLKFDTGRAGIVLPDGFLFGEGMKTNLKKELLDEFNLHTIVRLPKSVFAPYTSIATNLLFFEKGGPTKDIWYFEHSLPEGYKAYNKSKPMTIGEFDLEKKWWGGEKRRARKETEYAWKVSAKEIANRNYNLDIKNPHRVDVVYRDAEELIKEYQDIVSQLEKDQNTLNTELMAALGTGHTLVRYFNELFNSRENVAELKKAILQLAVMGKLVPQDPKEGTARELLEKLGEKRNLPIKKGAIRKSTIEENGQEVRRISNSLQIPVSWEWVNLKQLGYFLGGKTPSTNKSAYWNGNIPWVSPKDMKTHAIQDSEDHVTQSGINSGLAMIPANSILMVVRSGILRRAFPVAMNEVDCTINQDLKGLVPFSTEISPYLLLMLRGFETNILSKLTKQGVTVESIKFEEFISMQFPIPPLLEQNRIADKVNHLMQLCDNLNHQIVAIRDKQADLMGTVMVITA